MKLSSLQIDPDRLCKTTWADFETGSLLPDGPHESHLCVHVAALGNPKHREALKEMPDRAIASMRSSRRLQDVREGASLKALAAHVFIGWANLDDDDGNPMPYSADAALAILRDERNELLLEFVLDIAMELREQARQLQEDSLGN